MMSNENASVKKSDTVPFGIVFALFMYCGLNIALFTNTPGLFYAPVSEYLGIGRGEFSLYYSAQCVVTMIALLFSGKILSKFRAHIKVILSLVAIIQLLGYVCFSQGTSIIFWYFGAVLVGLGNAFSTHMLVGLLANNWFKVGAGTIIGLVFAFNSIIGAIASPMITTYLSTGPEAFRMVYLAIGVITAVVIVPTVIAFVRYAPEDVGKKPYGWSKVADSEGAADENAPVSGVEYSKALKSPAFWMLFVFVIVITGWASFNVALPGYASSIGYDALLVGIAASCVLVGGVIGKILLGILADKFGPYKSSAVYVVIGVVSMALFIANPNQILYLAGAVLFGISGAMLSVVAPVATRKYFGDLDYGPIYANINIGIWIGSAVIIPIYNFIFDFTGSYFGGMALAFVYIVGGYVLLLVGQRIANKLPRK